MLVFLIKLDWLSEKFVDVVAIGSRLFRLFLYNAPDYAKTFGDAVCPLMMDAQQMLVQIAEAFLKEQEETMSKFIDDYEEAQKKKRKKKLRVAKVEKDEEVCCTCTFDICVLFT